MVKREKQSKIRGTGRKSGQKVLVCENSFVDHSMHNGP